MIMILFFTRGVSLRNWVETGLFDREKLIYERHLNEGTFQTIYWITYGTDDKQLAEELKSQQRLHQKIEILEKPSFLKSRLGDLIFSVLMPLWYRNHLRQADVLKTNQFDGSWAALLAKRLVNKPLILRTGYTASLFVRRRTNAVMKQKFFEKMESLAYNACDYAIVASEHDRRYICEAYAIKALKIFTVYNYVDTNLFCPRESQKYDQRLIFVGRLSEQKNLFHLISALQGTTWELDIYGSGELQAILATHAREKNVCVRFQGTVANQELPQVLCRYRYYVLPSLYEGMPKTLLEAMACGLICLATDIPGVDEVITHEKDGYLIPGTEPQEIRKALDRIQQLDGTRLGQNAVEKIRSRFSLEMAVAEEKKVLDLIQS